MICYIKYKVHETVHFEGLFEEHGTVNALQNMLSRNFKQNGNSSTTNNVYCSHSKTVNVTSPTYNEMLSKIIIYFLEM
jgi:hypothetical protein